MAELTPVPAPRSPFIGWRGRAVSLVVVGILVAIAKPWGDDTPPQTVRPSPTAPPSAMPLVLEPVGRTYDPSAWGPAPTLGGWAIITPRGATTLDFLDRADATPGPSASGPTAGGEPVVVSGPVVDLGTTDEVDAFAIVHPAGTTLTIVRLWHFVGGAPPRRVDIGEVPAPWPATGVTMVAQRTGGMAPAHVLPWAAGLYRLDVLVEPATQPRSVMLAVRRGIDGGAAPVTGGGSPRGGGSFSTATLALLPDSANLWAAGGFLSGWQRAGVRRDCRVVEIWRASGPEDACWAVPLGPTDALGVNIADGRVVSAIALTGIDPLPGPAPVQAVTKVDGEPGRAMVRAPDGGLPDGIYRLDAVSGGTESSSWYFEVGPIGRAVAGYYETSTSR